MKPEKINIKIISPKMPEHDSDQALFTLFDFLLADKSQPVVEQKVETIKVIEPLS